MDDMQTLIFLEFLMPLVLAVSIYICKKYVDKKFSDQEKEDKKRHKEADDRAELRKEADMVIFDMAEAGMEMSYATSVAVEKGKTNGEMKKARKMYDDAKKERDNFMKKIKAEAVKVTN